MKKLIVFIFLVVVASCAFALEEEVVFDKDKLFDVYYEASETLEVDKLTRVYVKGIVMVGGEKFLNVINGGTIVQGDNGYVKLEVIKAILPTAMPVRRKIGAASVENSTS